MLAGGHSLIPLLRLRIARPTRARRHRPARRPPLRARGRRPDRDRRAHPPRRARSRPGCWRGLRADRRRATELVGDPQVRHRGTIGGSLAHADPASDLGDGRCSTLDAELVARGPDGERTIPAAEFFTRPVHETRSSRRSCSPRSASRPSSEASYLKYQRPAHDWATVGVAAAARRRSRPRRRWRAWGRPRCGRVRSRRRSRAVRRAAEAAARAAEGAEPPTRRERQQRVPRAPRAGARAARARAALALDSRGA